jgi:hypothetical protein
MTAAPPALRPVLAARVGAPVALFAGIAYSAFLLSPLTRPAGTRRVEFISELEVAGHPWSWLYRLADVGAGLAMVVTAATVRVVLGRRPGTGLGSALLGLAGIASVIDGATSMRCDTSTGGSCTVAEHTAGGLLSELGVLHTDSGVAGLLGAAAAAVLLGRVMVARWPVLGRLSITFGIAVACTGLLDVALLLLGADAGAAERTRTLLTSGWLVLLSGWLLTSARLPQLVVHAQRRRPAADPGATSASSPALPVAGRPDAPLPSGFAGRRSAPDRGRPDRIGPRPARPGRRAGGRGS